MSKKVIECEYCHTLISEDDVKCPECGANCTNAIKKYRKELEEKEKKEQKENMEAIQSFFNGFFKPKKIEIAIFLIIFIFISVLVIVQFNDARNFGNNKKESGNNTNIIIDDNIDDKIEKVTVGYQETAELDNLKITLDSYELYEYHSDHFDSYNTPKGYQKIAFHFVAENTSEKDTINLYSFVDLTADDTPVEKAKMEITSGFDKVVTGKEKYESINNQTLRSGQTLKGYVGYLVPKDKKVLKFLIGNITIEMDNPVYKG